MTDPTRTDRLITRQLDGEITPDERVELDRILAEDPTARRRRDEFVALESLLFAVGSTDRARLEDRIAVGSHIPPSARVPRAVALSGALLLALAIALAARLLPSPRGGTPDSPSLVIQSLSEGYLAVATPTEHPDVQIIWLYPADPRERTVE